MIIYNVNTTLKIVQTPDYPQNTSQCRIKWDNKRDKHK